MKKPQIAALSSFIAFWLMLIIVNVINSKHYNLDFIKDNNWGEVFITFFGIVILAFLASQITFRKGNFVIQFLNYFSVLCSVVTVVLAVNWIHSFNKTYEYQNQLVNEFKKEAEIDIKNDNVKIFSQGLILPPKNEYLQASEDSVQKIITSYGLTRKNLGCVISPELTAGIEKYNEITAAYLEKRNGKNWSERMYNQIDSIRSSRSNFEILNSSPTRIPPSFPKISNLFYYF